MTGSWSLMINSLKPDAKPDQNTLSDFRPVGYYMGEMQPKSDAQLLCDYAEHGTEAAFAELVHRHTNLVYSAALRQVEAPASAAEITQNVFVGLARGAKSLFPRLAADASLAGWLCRSARNLSLNHRRDEFRRQTRERQVMEQLASNPEDTSNWENLRGRLDEAMAELSETDYDALVLRYFQNYDFRAVGVALGVSDDTAQKRVTRALEKLREVLSRRGVSTSATALSVVISANAVQAAPVGLALTISTAAALTGTTLATTATKAIAMTALQKTIIGATLAVAVGTGIYEARQASQLREQVQTLQQQQTPLAEQIQLLESEREKNNEQIAALRDDNERLNRNTAELLKLRGEVARLRREIADSEIPPEPSYQGKTLRYWIAPASDLPNASNQERLAYRRAALLAMGEPAIRYLHWMITHPQLSLGEDNNDINPENKRAGFMSVILAIKLIGPRASGLAPDLVRLWESNDDPMYSTYNGFPVALAEIGNNSPEVIAALHRHFTSRDQLHGALSALAAWRLNQNDTKAADIVRRSLIVDGGNDVSYALLGILSEISAKATPFDSEIRELIDKSAAARPDQQAIAAMASWRLFHQPDLAIAVIQRLGTVASKADATANEVSQFAAAANVLMEIPASRQNSIPILKKLKQRSDESASEFCSQVLARLERVENGQ
jgi:RNA polymerase sigma factor (sigma-70 family)